MSTVKRETEESESGCCFCFRHEDLCDLIEPDDYAAMIADCFRIQINTSDEEFYRNLYVICEFCISRLRDAFHFRIDVQNGLNRIENIIKCGDKEHNIRSDRRYFEKRNSVDKDEDKDDRICADYDLSSMCKVEMGRGRNDDDDKDETGISGYKTNKGHCFPPNCTIEIDAKRIEDHTKNISGVSGYQTNQAYDYSTNVSRKDDSGKSTSGALGYSMNLENNYNQNCMVEMCSKQDYEINKSMIANAYQVISRSIRLPQLKTIKKPRDVRQVKQRSSKFTPTLNKDMDLITLAGMVCNEKTAIEFFQICGIIPQQKICENGHVMCISFTDSAPKWRCHMKSCRIKRGIRQNTWLQKSRITLEVAVRFIYYWSKEMTSVKFCAEQLGMSQPSVVDWNNQLREVCVWRVNQYDSQIGGDGLHVEIDETVFNRPKSNAGKNLPSQWMFGGMCRETKDCFIVPVPQTTLDIIFPIIVEKIKPGTTIISSSWRAYNDLVNFDSVESAVDPRYRFVSPEMVERTQDIERLWISAKLSNKKRRGTDRNFLESYIGEFLWKSKLGETEPFEQILRDIVAFWEANQENIK